MADDVVELAPLQVTSPRVANAAPAGSMTMPVSGLRFEPAVDIQSRNMAESQADVAIRGGIFENTGFRVGSVALFDPQTGHYLAELPITPEMLSSPRVLTGADNALLGVNANVGTIAYDWRPVETRGELSASFGDYHFDQQSVYQGFADPTPVLGQKIGVDLEAARSESRGSVPYGESHFQRYNGRIQLHGGSSQTDLFYGYQSKLFGWPNLYTPFNSNETENLETALILLNHRIDLGGGDYVEGGVFYRRNKDDYAFNRFAPLTSVHPFQHTTWVRGGGFDGRGTIGPVVVNYSGQVMADELRSTSLTFGRFHTRTYTKLAAIPEITHALDAQKSLVVRAGATWDETNRDGSAVSPVAEVALEDHPSAKESYRYFAQYAKSTQVPTYTALNSSTTGGLFRGNPNLGRETSHNFELGFSTRQNAWQVQSSAFYRRDDHLVDWTFTRTVTARTANAVDIDTLGWETVVTYTAPRWRAVVGYTILSKDADYLGARVDASFYALNYPRHRLTAALVAQLGGGFEARMDNEFRSQAANFLRTTGGHQTVMSSAGLYYRPPAAKQWEFYVLVDNFWNSGFQEVPAVPASRRQLAGGATFHW